MNSQVLEPPEETIRLLQEELAQTNREVLALTVELEKRVEERTAELRVAQQELEHKNSRLEAANRELEAFSYSVSHDLRAPLRHVQGYARILQEDCGGTLDNQCSEYLAAIARSTEQMNALIQDLLSFAQMGQRHRVDSEVDFDQLVQDIINELKPEQGQRQIEWIAHSLGAVRGDDTMLRQVWFNLIANAVKYTRKKDQTRIEIGRLDSDSDDAIYFVRDNGAGFNSSDRDKLFSPFQRLHSKQEFEGTGLGLAIVRRIIDRHLGRTWAEGAAGHGATFFFALPKKALVSQ